MIFQKKWIAVIPIAVKILIHIAISIKLIDAISYNNAHILASRPGAQLQTVAYTTSTSYNKKSCD